MPAEQNGFAFVLSTGSFFIHYFRILLEASVSLILAFLTISTKLRNLPSGVITFLRYCTLRRQFIPFFFEIPIKCVFLKNSCGTSESLISFTVTD